MTQVSDPNNLLDSVEYLDLKDKANFRELQPLNKARATANSCFINEFLYVYGGFSGDSSRTRIIERLALSKSDKLEDQQWEILNMKLSVGFDGAYSFVQSDSSILVVGGKYHKDASKKCHLIDFREETVINTA